MWIMTWIMNSILTDHFIVFTIWGPFRRQLSVPTCGIIQQSTRISSEWELRINGKWFERLKKITIFFMADSFQIFNGMNCNFREKVLPLLTLNASFLSFFFIEKMQLYCCHVLYKYLYYYFSTTGWYCQGNGGQWLCVFWWTFEIYFWYLGITICLTGSLILSLLMLLRWRIQIWVKNFSCCDMIMKLKWQTNEVIKSFGYTRVFVPGIQTRVQRLNFCSSLTSSPTSYHVEMAFSRGNAILTKLQNCLNFTERRRLIPH